MTGALPKKFRGIKTTQEPLNEYAPKTIVNRLGQKSISLPRIDDGKRWAGFPGLSGVARRITNVIPECRWYVEPFAGTAKVFQEILKSKKFTNTQFVLNDKSKFIFNWLLKEFFNDSNVVILVEDFTNCIKCWDGPETFFLFDIPWNRSYYDQKFSCFDRYAVKEYEEEILKICETIQGKFIITTRKESIRMKKSKFYNTLVTSEYVVSGKYPKVMLTSNFKIDGRKLR
ncbi:hypothetical protein LCGC14_0380710 [marine sediment metagenome]|uniref:DNA adenine methylase n=1 Tax=marine sediment metagenome TaxID=412755 RepID=A0A0F9T2A4_9ZZZZ